MAKEPNLAIDKTLKPSKNCWWSKTMRFLRNFILLFFIVSIVWVIIDRFMPIYFTPLMGIRSVESIFNGKTPKISKEWVSIDDISPNIVQAVVASEDNLFLSHYGFSFKAISKAIDHNQKAKRIHGGSTISQQTAKNVFLFPQRSYIRKGLEAYFTVLMELIWNKKRIMEVYLNVIEMGDGIYGVEAASQEYFGIHSSRLSKNQAAAIAACLPNPRRFHANNPSGYIQRREAKILNIMGKIGTVNFDKKPAETKKTHKHKRK